MRAAENLSVFFLIFQSLKSCAYVVQQGEFVPALVRGQFRREMRERAAALQRGESAALSLSTNAGENDDDDESDEKPYVRKALLRSFER